MITFQSLQHLIYFILSIGSIYQRTGDLQKAIECFETSLRLKRKQYVGSNLSVAETMNLLAQCQMSNKKLEKAIPLYEEALAVFEKKFGAHLTTANVLDSLGSAYLSEGKIVKAHCYLERALALKRLIYGDDDNEVSNTLFLIGKVQSKSGDLNDALDTFKDGESTLRCISFVTSSTQSNLQPIFLSEQCCVSERIYLEMIA